MPSLPPIIIATLVPRALDLPEVAPSRPEFRADEPIFLQNLHVMIESFPKMYYFPRTRGHCLFTLPKRESENERIIGDVKTRTCEGLFLEYLQSL